MMNLCIAELSEIVEGSVSLGAMPPLAGLYEPVGRVVVDVREVQSRDVLWTFHSPSRQAGYQAEEAFSRGALGVVLSGRRMEPWAGKFCVSVTDAIEAMHRMMRCLRTADGNWPATVFSQDKSTREIMQAVWQRDPQAIRSLVERLDQQAISAA